MLFYFFLCILIPFPIAIRNQILMAKKLIEDGNEMWATISFDKTRVLWTCAIPEIVKKFMCISNSKNRGLMEQVSYFFVGSGKVISIPWECLIGFAIVIWEYYCIY